MISSSINRNPVFVVPTPTFSKVENSEVSSIDIGEVDSESYANVSLVGLTSEETPNISTLLSFECIP